MAYISKGDTMKYTVTPCDFDYNTNKRIIEDLIREYPFIKVKIIGRTAIGRSIFALSVGNTKNCGVYVGSVRGSDGLSGLILLLFIERLSCAIKNNRSLASVNIRKALALSGVTVIPCLNPDGREIFIHGIKGAKRMGSFVSSFYNNKEAPEWNANAMGVDINLNFMPCDTVKRKFLNPAPSLYCGDYPESEAETGSFTRLCRLSGFRQCMEIFWGDREIFYKSDEEEPVSSQMMAKILSCSSSVPLNYEKSTDHSGLTDWFIREFRRPAFSVGTGGSVEKLFETYSLLEEVLTVFALL